MSGGNLVHSKEDIINTAKLIYDEIVKRVNEGKMKHEFKPDQMSNWAKQLYDLVSKGKAEEAIPKEMEEYTSSVKEVESIIKEFVDFTIIKDFISLVGSNVKRDIKDRNPNDIDLHIRMAEPSDYIKRAVQVRILKMLPEEIGNKIHFIWGDPEGSHDTFIPLYDLMLKKLEPSVVKMADTTTTQNPDTQATSMKPAEEK